MNTHRGTKTIPEQIEIANEIFKKVISARPTEENQEACAKLLDKISSEYKDFYVTHPLVVKYMCFMGAYHPAAFEGYLAAIAKNPAKTAKIDGFLETQADYVVRLMRALNPSGTTGKQARELKRKVLGMLQEEHQGFKRAYDGAIARAEASEAKALKESRKTLKKIMTTTGVSGVGTIRVEAAGELKNEAAGEIKTTPAIESARETPIFSGADQFL